MAFQTSVNQKQAFGVVGSFYDDSPRIVDPKVIGSESAGSIGCFYTIDSTDPSKVVLGGTGVLAGIAVNAKGQVIDGLGASLAFKQYDIAEICSMGRIVLSIAGTVTVGMAAYYNTTTGVITAAAPSSTIEGSVEIPNSCFVEVGATPTAPICVLELR